MPFRIFSTSVKRRTTAKFADANTNDGNKLPRRFRATKKYVAPCGNCRFRLHAFSDFLGFRKTENHGKNLLAQIDERRQTSCRVVSRTEEVSPHAEVAVSVCMLFQKLLTFVKRSSSARICLRKLTNDGNKLPRRFTHRSSIAPCGNCRFRLHAFSDFLDFRKTENYGKIC